MGRVDPSGLLKKADTPPCQWSKVEHVLFLASMRVSVRCEMRIIRSALASFGRAWRLLQSPSTSVNRGPTPMINLTVNGNAVSFDADPEMPLLWAVRETLQLTGTKFGCGMSLCGACTVHLDGQAVRSCITPLS